MGLFETKKELERKIESLNLEIISLREKKLDVLEWNLYDELNDRKRIFESRNMLFLEKEKELHEKEIEIQTLNSKVELKKSELISLEKEIDLMKRAASKEIELMKEIVNAKIDCVKTIEDSKSKMYQAVIIDKNNEIARLAEFVSKGHVNFKQEPANIFVEIKEEKEEEEEFFYGENIYVRDSTEGDWRVSTFVSKINGKIICMKNNIGIENISANNISVWNFAKKINE